MQIVQDLKKQLRAKLQRWQQNERHDLGTGALGLSACQLTFVPVPFLKTSDFLTWVAHGLRCSCYVDRLERQPQCAVSHEVRRRGQ